MGRTHAKPITSLRYYYYKAEYKSQVLLLYTYVIDKAEYTARMRGNAQQSQCQVF
jgi:hypothetical protein